jgi:hypothetical protein
MILSKDSEWSYAVWRARIEDEEFHAETQRGAETQEDEEFHAETQRGAETQRRREAKNS